MADKNMENSENQLEELRTWISGIPLPKPTKNLTRDFSDAVMMAEILKVYYPRHVDLHNYAPVNSLIAKKENWNILNRKVLSKINMKLSKDMIHELANCQPGTAEQVLIELKKKISKDSEHQGPQDLSYDCKENSTIEEGNLDGQSTNNTTSEQLTPNPVNESTLEPLERKKSVFKRAKELIYLVLMWLINCLCIWNYFPSFRLSNSYQTSLQENTETSREQRTSENLHEKDTALHQALVRVTQKLSVLEDAVRSLNHKITYLEGETRLEDL